MVENITNKVTNFWKDSNKKRKSFIVVSCLFLVILLILIPMSLASLEPVRKVTILSENANYESKDPTSFKIEKSGKWTAKGEAEITFDLETILKTKYKYTDILFVLDTSGSMVGSKLDRLKEDATELIHSLINNNGNKAGIITFDTTSTIVSGLTDNKDSLVEMIQNLTTGETTNYYQAFENVDEILRNYTKENDRQFIVLFLTDGYPNEETPN